MREGKVREGKRREGKKRQGKKIGGKWREGKRREEKGKRRREKGKGEGYIRKKGVTSPLLLYFNFLSLPSPFLIYIKYNFATVAKKL